MISNSNILTMAAIKIELDAIAENLKRLEASIANNPNVDPARTHQLRVVYQDYVNVAASINAALAGQEDNSLLDAIYNGGEE